MSALIILLEVLIFNKARKEVKCTQIRKEEIKSFLFTDGIIIYLKNISEN